MKKGKLKQTSNSSSLVQCIFYIKFRHPNTHPYRIVYQHVEVSDIFDLLTILKTSCSLEISRIFCFESTRENRRWAYCCNKSTHEQCLESRKESSKKNTHHRVIRTDGYAIDPAKDIALDLTRRELKKSHWGTTLA
jgi:hypothetical protein